MCLYVYDRDHKLTANFAFLSQIDHDFSIFVHKKFTVVMKTFGLLDSLANVCQILILRINWKYCNGTELQHADLATCVKSDDCC